MMTTLDGAIVALRAGRIIVLARDDDQARFEALRAFGVREAVAAHLIIVKVRAG